MKFQKDGQIVEVTDSNTFSIFIREGFTEVKDVKLAKEKNKEKD